MPAKKTAKPKAKPAAAKRVAGAKSVKTKVAKAKPAKRTAGANAKVATRTAGAKAKAAKRTAGKAKANAKPVAAKRVAGKTKATKAKITAAKRVVGAKKTAGKAKVAAATKPAPRRKAGLFGGLICTSRWSDIGKIVNKADTDLREYIHNNASCTTDAHADAPEEKQVIPNISTILSNLSSMIRTRGTNRKINSAALESMARESANLNAAPAAGGRAGGRASSSSRASRSAGHSRSGGFHDSRLFEPVTFRDKTHSHQGYMEKSTGRLFMNPN